MERRNQPDVALLARYFTGAAALAEVAAVDAWVSADPAHRSELDAFREAWERAALVPDDDAVDAMWRATAARMTSSTTQPSRAHSHPWLHGAATRTLAPGTAWLPGVGGHAGRVSLTRRGRLLAARCAAIAIVAGVVTVWRFSRLTPPQQFREFASAPGSRTTVTLRDGTRLVLGPSTHLRVPADFGRAGRTVSLDGEALFSVVHDEQHPFAVEIPRAVVRDVGTTFVVRAYSDDLAGRVAVSEGRVSIRSCGHGSRLTHSALVSTSCPSADLAAGDVATMTGTSIAITHHANLTALTAWMQGHLVFDETPLPDVVRQLIHTFDLEIAVADSSLLPSTVTASFDRESADEILTVITQAIGGHYERRGRHVVIRRGATDAGRIPPESVDAMRTAQADRLRHLPTGP